MKGTPFDFCKQLGLCDNTASCDDGCKKYADMLPKQEHSFSKNDKVVEQIIEEKTRSQFQGHLNQRKRRTTQGMPQEIANFLMSEEIIMGKEAPQPQLRFENQLDKCEQTAVTMCPRPACSFHGVCSIVNKRGETIK